MFNIPWFGKNRLSEVEINNMYRQAQDFQQSGQVESAAVVYRQLQKHLPDNPEVLRLLGVAECQCGRLKLGLEWMGKAEKFAQDNIYLQLNMGLACLALKDNEAAELHLSKALELDAACVDAHFNFGNLYDAYGNYAMAVRSFENCVRLRGGADDFHNLACAEFKRGCHEKALMPARRAAELAPNRADILFGLGNVLLANELREEAVEVFDRAIQISPDSAAIHWNKAVACLALGHLREGWKEFQWRPGVRSLCDSLGSRRLWLGDASLEGKVLFVTSEHGQGDVLQFSRYLKFLPGLGAKVIFEVQESMAVLMHGMVPMNVVVQGKARPDFDYFCPLLSLPHALHNWLGVHIPCVEGYIRAAEDKVAAWKSRLHAYHALRVGLVWSSGFHPGDPESWGIYLQRNIPLEMLAPLNLAGVRFFSLQKGADAVAQLKSLQLTDWQGPEIVDWTSELHDFSDTAALIENLDLVISVDTSVIHLAGAMGKQAWLINRRDTCWRWGLSGEYSEWYSSIRIFRQEIAGDWSSVVATITAELERLAKKCNS